MTALRMRDEADLILQPQKNYLRIFTLSRSPRYTAITYASVQNAMPCTDLYSLLMVCPSLRKISLFQIFTVIWRNIVLKAGHRVVDPLLASL